MKSDSDVILSSYFLNTFKDNYKLKKQFILTIKNLNSDCVYLYNKNLFDPENIKKELYDNFLKGRVVEPKKVKITYIDLKINNPFELYVYNFVREYVKLYNQFKSYKHAKKALKENETQSFYLQYVKIVNKKYEKIKIDYLNHRITFKTLFKNDTQLGNYYLYLANCGITESNINITTNNLL